MSNCIHCGLPNGKNPVTWNDKEFCCDGCAMVYQILNKNELNRYYELMPTPGIKIENQSFGDKYAYLDNEDFRKKYIDFSDGGIEKVTLFIPSIHCSSCIWLLEKLNHLHGGIMYSGVHFVRKEVSITYKTSQISFRQLVELLHSIHYIPELTYKRSEKDDNQAINRQYLMKIGVAGFAFGNIMLLSFPDYLPGGESVDRFLADAFGYLSFILALPVLLYCSLGFFSSAFKNLRKGIINIDLPISLGIIALFAESTYEIFSHSGTGYMDSLAGLLFFMLIGRWYQSKSYQSLSFERDYKSYFPVAVTRINPDDSEEYIELGEIKEGDTLLIRNQELIPADANILEGEGNIDYSFVTGESVPVIKQKDDFVYAGGRQNGSGIRIKIVKEVAQSYLTRLWNEDKIGGKSKEDMQQAVNHVSHYFTLIILAIAVLAGVYWSFTSLGKAAYVFATILIIACPCALALSVPFTLGSTMRVFGRNGFYLKNTHVIEKLAKINSVVFDKTGTLTHSQSMKVEWFGRELNDKEKQIIRTLARQSTHPASVALWKSLPESKDITEIKNLIELPSLGISAEIAGHRVLLGSHRFIAGSEKPEENASTEVHISLDNKYIGKFSLENHYREGLAGIIKALKNFRLHLLTGDNDSERKNLINYFVENTALLFNQSPTDKLNYLKELRKNGHYCAMIGDGLNDAGALLEANVGITIADDIYHFSPACDAILEAERFERLPDFLNFSKISKKIIYSSFIISFLYNIIGLTFAVQGVLSPVIAAVLMPVSSITIVIFTTGMVRLFAWLRRMR